ncbi:putative ethanolamine transporter [Escherichia coli]|uniref:Putative ethanolamine transporter n=1 Tax=Escherichia coli TaxID=562 RepID=A0A376KPB7_ECOLX|nr:putative ethanolamine transporter [Escherichia coli]
MGINEIIMYIMMFFMLIAAVDRILSQFGGSARFLGKFGKKYRRIRRSVRRRLYGNGRSGSGDGRYDRAGTGTGSRTRAGNYPGLRNARRKPVNVRRNAAGVRYGRFLPRQRAGGRRRSSVAILWVNSWVDDGPTIVFSIPVALGIIEPSDRRYLALGVLAGIVTIPIGCIAGGLVAMYSGVQINGQPVEFTFALILMNMIPVIIVAILVALGLKFIPEKMINGFQIFAKFLVALITLGLAAAVVKFLLGWELIPGLDPIFMAPGDKPGEVMRAIEVIGSISCVLLGAYPMVLLLTRWF